MQKYVMGKLSVDDQPPPSQGSGAVFEDDKTVTQGQFTTQQARPSFSGPPVKDNIPGSPRRVPIGASITRSASAAAARLPFPDGLVHRDIPGRPASVNPAQQLSNAPKFWDGSTVDGSLFSDSASNFDISERPAQRPSRLQQVSPQQDRQFPTHKHHASSSSHNHRVKRELPAEDRSRFTIGENGLIGRSEIPSVRPSAWTLSGGHDRRSHFSRVVDDFDQASEGSRSFSSPERDSPTSKRSHQARQVTVGRSPQQAAKPRRTSPAPARTHAPHQEQDVKVPALRLQESKAEHPRPQRQDYLEAQVEVESADPDSLMSDPVETESDEPEQEPTPKKTTKSTKIGGSKPQVERQLFGDTLTNGRHARGDLVGLGRAQSSLPRLGMQANKHTLEPDYDDQALASMRFDKLQHQDFDFDPAKAEALSADLPQGTLDEKLRHFVNRDKETQSDFFQKMSVREWEDSGDWFLERFTDIVKNFKEARQSRRALADQFEDEVASRADSVRSKIVRIDGDLKDMKEKGAVIMQREFQ
ncbi:extracellular mutant protein 11-domain-containing protein [Microdochium bolleyi]|uniref:Extracellular mutant protein 11-domain-containing protein n=1 Tax=Microdochium bolleyi TaxID=196109 RepID=A0A136J5L0_9PEZI|nr:extracellular mutant protein 11-domain-containing protein [Microdochium bolleyi]